MYRVVLLGIFVFPSTACAQDEDDWREWPFAERFRVYAQAFFPALDTEVRLDSSNGLVGTTINFEQNLGLEDTKTIPAAGIGWRFARKHRIRFDYFELNRSAASVTTSEIRFGDEVFQTELPVSSFFDTRVYSLSYSYSLLFNESAEIGLLVGLSVQDIGFGLKSNMGQGIIEEETGVTAPLPLFGVTGAYSINDKWSLRGGVSYFALDLSLSDEDKLGGEIVSLEASIEYAAFENISFDLRYAFFDLSTRFEGLGRLSEIDYRYQGPKLGIIGRF